MNDEEKSMLEETLLVHCAIGRIFRLLSRPFQPGDMEEYEHCRNTIQDHFPVGKPDWYPGYSRDYYKESRRT